MVTMLCLVAVVVPAAPIDGGDSPTFIISRGWNGKVAVKDTSGRIIDSSYDARMLIQRYVDRTPYGGTVQMRAGVFNLNGEILMKSGVTLTGSGHSTVVENGGIRIVDASSVTVMNMRTQGICTITLQSSSGSVHDVTVRDITAYNVQNKEAAFVVDALEAQHELSSRLLF
jgi:polygalacturonase